jgi:hypothetical protein
VRVFSFFLSFLYLDDFKPPTFCPHTWGQYVEFSQTCAGKDIDVLSQGWGFALLVRSLAKNSSHARGIVNWKEPDPSREAFVMWHWAFSFFDIQEIYVHRNVAFLTLSLLIRPNEVCSAEVL